MNRTTPAGMSKRHVDHRGTTLRWYTRAQLEAGTDLPSRHVARALWDLGRAESRGFWGCWAVFEDAHYEGLDEAASEAFRAAGGGWGRGQDVTYHSTVVHGELVPDMTYPVPPPEWTGLRSGLACHVVVNRFGARCGYVTVPPGHPAYGLRSDEVGARVHGGLTYAHDGPDKEGWTFGFDCSHAGDAGLPEYERRAGTFFGDGVYRSLPYVIAEIERLAEHLAAMVPDAVEVAP